MRGRQGQCRGYWGNTAGACQHLFSLTETPDKTERLLCSGNHAKCLTGCPGTGTFIIPVLQTLKLRFREVKRLASGLAARRAGAGNPRSSRSAAQSWAARLSQRPPSLLSVSSGRS